MRSKHLLLMALLIVGSAGLYGCNTHSGGGSDGGGPNGGNDDGGNPTTDVLDQDSDGVPDKGDICPMLADHDQNDLDRDGIGDVCDPDPDGDGVNSVDGSGNPLDNCTWVSNAAQTDTDGDGLGDACDNNVDPDNDGHQNDGDNCPADYNASQTSTDHDQKGYKCDFDPDNDGPTGPADNCPYVANNAAGNPQVDSDGDGIGDACEGDSDGDGEKDQSDNCPFIPNPDQADNDKDNVGDICDDDDDNDGYDDGLDDCPTAAGTGTQPGMRGCPVNPANDQDNDGIPDGLDNCPTTPNADQKDADGDGVGDVCDTDGFTCSSTTPFQPLTASDYTAEADTLGVCLGCGVDNLASAIDNDGDTYAQYNIGLAAVYGGQSMTIKAKDPSLDITGADQIGFVIGDPDSRLLNLSVLGNFVTLHYLNDGQEVGSATVDGSLLGLDLLGVGTGTGQRFLAAEIDPSLTFDSVRLDYAGVLNANGSLRVYNVCVGPLPVAVP